MADPESNKPRPIKKQLSSGKLLLDDTGWLAPLNKMVWKTPNAMLYVMLVIDTVVYFVVKQGGFSTGSVRANDRRASSSLSQPATRDSAPSSPRASTAVLQSSPVDRNAVDVHEHRTSPRHPPNRSPRACPDPFPLLVSSELAAKPTLPRCATRVSSSARRWSRCS